MAKSLQSQVSMESEMDIGKATAFSYYYGYLRILAQAQPVGDRLRKARAGCSVVPKLFLLCPLDGKLPKKTTDLVPELTSAGYVIQVTAEVAGARQRQYGNHPLYQLALGGEPDARSALLAVEPVSAITTLRKVSEAMNQSSGQMQPLSLRNCIEDLVKELRRLIAREPSLSGQVELVRYERPAEVAEALRDAAEKHICQLARDSPQPPREDVGRYLAWAFMHGYLLTMAQNRNIPEELAQLKKQEPACKNLHILRLVIVCPLKLPQVPGERGCLPDNITKLDDDLEHVKNVTPVQIDGPAQPGRQYGSFSIYRSKESGNCFALELATPLCTLARGLLAEKHPETYPSEAESFVTELKTLMFKHDSAMAQQYQIVRTDGSTNLHSALKELRVSQWEK